MKKHITALLVFFGICVISIGAISIYIFSSHKPPQQNTQKDDIEIFKVEQIRKLVKYNDIFANDYNNKTIYLTGLCYSADDKEGYYEVKLAPLKSNNFSFTRFNTISCKFPLEQKKSLAHLKKNEILVIKGNISINKGLVRNTLEMYNCIIVDEKGIYQSIKNLLKIY